MSQTLIKNANILSMDSNRSVYIDSAILVEDNDIKEIGKLETFESRVGLQANIEDAKQNWILPGLINTHVHTSHH